MLTVDEALLRDPRRLAAVAEARPAMAALPGLLDAIAAFAARAVAAPMALVSLVGDSQEYVYGAYDPADALAGQTVMPLAYSVGKFVLGRNLCAGSTGSAGGPPRSSPHPLAARFGIESFAGVALTDGGQCVGSLAVLDTRARQWPDEQTGLLKELVGNLSVEVLAAAAPPAVGLDLGALLDNVQEAFLAVDADATVVCWNRAAQELLGFTAAEVCGRRLDDNLFRGHLGQPVGVALTRLFGAAPRRRVYRVGLRHRDGHRVDVRAALSVLPASGGHLACAFLSDLSGQVAAEHAAERNDRFLDALLDSLSVGVMACDDRGEVVVVNKALRNVQPLPGGSRAAREYAEPAAATLLHADLTPMSWSQTPLMRALRGEHVHDSEVLVRSPGHRLRTFATNAQPIVGGDHRRLGAVAVAHEVTAVRRAEQFRQCHLAVAQVLAASEVPDQAALGVLRVLATTLGWPYAELWLIDEGTDGLRRIGSWSAPGLDTGELGSHTVTRGAGIIGRVWATGGPVWVRDITEPRGDPDPRLAAFLRLGLRTVLAVPVRDGDTTLGVLTCSSGAPEHHEDLLTVLLDGVAAQFGMFVALRRAAALARELDRAKDDYIALVGHEMRTPLTTIAANAGMLREDAATFDPETRQMLTAIHRNAVVLQDIVSTLLDLAGLDAGHIGLTVRPADLAEVVAGAIAAAGPGATARGVTLTGELPARLTAEADAGRIRQLVDNLLSNAVKYSPAGGAVRVRLAAGEDSAELEIADDGLGVPDAERDHVFERLYRGSNVRHRGTTGNGLGLSLARVIVELHGGTITLTGREPTGTVVSVRLPLGTGSRPAPPLETSHG